MDTGSFYYIASQYKFWIQKSGWWAGINEEQTSGNGQTLWRRGFKFNKLELGPMGESGAINLFVVVKKKYDVNVFEIIPEACLNWASVDNTVASEVKIADESYFCTPAERSVCIYLYW